MYYRIFIANHFNVLPTVSGLPFGYNLCHQMIQSHHSLMLYFLVFHTAVACQGENYGL